MKATEIATKAANLVGGDRHEDHGDMTVTFASIALLWDAYLKSRRHPGSHLTPVDVGHMMALLKIARTQSGRVNADDWVDSIGYLACAGEIALRGVQR